MHFFQHISVRVWVALEVSFFLLLFFFFPRIIQHTRSIKKPGETKKKERCRPGARAKERTGLDVRALVLALEEVAELLAVLVVQLGQVGAVDLGSHGYLGFGRVKCE